MTSKVLIVGSFVTLITAVLLAFYRMNAEQNLLKLFERNINRSLCVLCLGNTPSCNTFDFKLDYKRHADICHHSNYLFVSVVLLKHLFDYWTSQQNDKIFFGHIKLYGVNVPAVAKSPGHFYCESFERIINITSDIDTVITNNQWNLLPFDSDSRSLVLCSKDDTESFSLLHNLFYSVIRDNNSNNSQSLVELWVSAHLNVELLILKILNGYRYVPNLYGICARVYFVEDCGYTLQHHLNNMSLSNRLLVAKELLTLALELTDGTAHSNYSFYLTDLTADNIAIQFDKISGLLQSLKIIDWSDVILVANDHNVSKNDNLMIHVSEHVDCGPGCLAYSKKEICQFSFSDHNVYAVCKEFLSVEDNLLHGMIITKESKELESLVQYCLWHSDVDHYSNNSRLHTAKLIITAIQIVFQQSLYNNNN